MSCLPRLSGCLLSPSVTVFADVREDDPDASCGEVAWSCPVREIEMTWLHLTIYPKVNEYAWTPGSRKVISKVRSVMGPGWRMSWYTRCCARVPWPSWSMSDPWAWPGGCPSRRTRNRTEVPGVAGPVTRLRSRAWKRQGDCGGAALPR